MRWIVGAILLLLLAMLLNLGLLAYSMYALLGVFASSTRASLPTWNPR